MTSRNLFLSTVLATEGLYCVVGLKKGNPKQQFVKTVEEVDSLVDSLVEQGYEAYFGCAKYETDEGRTTKNAKWFKSFWLDLDCGEGKEYEKRHACKKCIVYSQFFDILHSHFHPYIASVKLHNVSPFLCVT